jgi:hypothetical protein
MSLPAQNQGSEVRPKHSWQIKGQFLVYSCCFTLFWGKCMDWLDLWFFE